MPFENSDLSLKNYADLIEDPATYKVIFNTVMFTIGSTTIGLGLSLVYAWLIERTNIIGRGCLFALILMPMAIPNMIYAAAWIQLLNPSNGWINVLLRDAGLPSVQIDIFGLGGMILVQGFALASHAYLLLAAPFRMLDSSWEEQSAVSGKRMLTTLVRITLPVLKPAILAGAIFFAIVAMETFDISLTNPCFQYADLLGDASGFRRAAELRYGKRIVGSTSHRGHLSDRPLSEADQAREAVRHHHRKSIPPSSHRPRCLARAADDCGVCRHRRRRRIAVVHDGLAQFDPVLCRAVAENPEYCDPLRLSGHAV
jgi:ABC-type spermidine/putrescine transport system permease subunit II